MEYIFYGHLIYITAIGIFYGHLVYFMAIWYILWHFRYILWSFGILLPVLVCCTKKNLATRETRLGEFSSIWAILNFLYLF
jgi:hypothetical protein